jgi:GAF domain-containing protein
VAIDSSEQSSPRSRERREKGRRKEDRLLQGQTAELKSEVGVLQVICNLSSTLHEASTSEAFCDAALTALYQALKAERSSILLLDSAGQMRFKAWRGLSDQYRKAVDGHSPWSPGDPNPKPILFTDVSEEQGLGDLQQAVIQEGIRSLAFFPLISKQKLLGKFMVYFDAPHPFTDSEQQLAQTIANHVALALERRRHEEELRQALQEVGRAKTELEEKVRELENFEEVVVGRELKMIALEKEIARLKSNLPEGR